MNAQRVAAIFTPKSQGSNSLQSPNSNNSWGQSHSLHSPRSFNSFDSSHSFHSPPNENSHSAQQRQENVHYNTRYGAQQQEPRANFYNNKHYSTQSGRMQPSADDQQSDNVDRPKLATYHNTSLSPTCHRSYNTLACQTEDLNAVKGPSEAPLRAKSKMYTFEKLNINLDDIDLSNQEIERFKLLINFFGDSFGKSIEDIRSGSSYPPISLPFTSDYTPTRSRPYWTSLSAQTEINRQVEELLENNIIEESSSLQSSPLMLVRKPNNTYRMVLDFRKANLGFKTISFPLISLKHVIDRLSSKKFVYLSQLDFLSGFTQLFVKEQDGDISSFVTGDSSIRYKKLVFGLSSSPTLFSIAMSTIFRKYLKTSALLYIEDILVMSENFENHLEDLENFFYKLQAI